MGVLRALENDPMFNGLIRETKCHVSEPQVNWDALAPVLEQHGSIVAYSIIHS